MKKLIEVKQHCNYTHKNDCVILDTQYDYEGKYLAVGDILGQICIYDNEQKALIISHQENKGAVMKLAWSLPHLGNYLASSFIDKFIYVYQINQTKQDQLIPIVSKSFDCIATCLTYCPTDLRLLLAVGLSNGRIIIFNNEMHTISSTDAHEMTVNCLSWQADFIISNKKVEWVKRNFSNVEIYEQGNGIPLIASVSSDRYLIIWRLETTRLVEIAKVKAHQKEIREVNWKPNLFSLEKMIVTCSQDCSVKVWVLNKKQIVLKSTLLFPSTVWKVIWNPLGNMLIISHTREQSIETKIYTQDKGILKQYTKIV